jgi:hypothetical protein
MIDINIYCLISRLLIHVEIAKKNMKRMKPAPIGNILVGYSDSSMFLTRTYGDRVSSQASQMLCIIDLASLRRSLRTVGSLNCIGIISNTKSLPE